MPQETYSLAALSEDVDEDRSSHTQYAPLENMLSAAHLVATLLTRQHRLAHPREGLDPPKSEQDCCYGIQGGFSIQLRGGRRSTRDIDLVTSTKMKGTWEALTGEERYVATLPRWWSRGNRSLLLNKVLIHFRIVLPDSRLVEGVLKTFVKTGSPWDACSEQHRVEVDIKQAGFRKSPRILAGNVDQVGPFDLFGQSIQFSVLSIPYMMRIKVECCLTRAEQRDFEDVKWMVANYTDVICRAIGDTIFDEDELIEVLDNVRIGEEDERMMLLRLLEDGHGQKEELS